MLFPSPPAFLCVTLKSWEGLRTRLLLSSTTSYQLEAGLGFFEDRVGRVKVKGMVKQIIQEAKIEWKFNNHSMLATGATVLPYSMSVYQRPSSRKGQGHSSTKALRMYKQVTPHQDLAVSKILQSGKKLWFKAAKQCQHWISRWWRKLTVFTWGCGVLTWTFFLQHFDWSASSVIFTISYTLIFDCDHMFETNHYISINLLVNWIHMYLWLVTYYMSVTGWAPYTKLYRGLQVGWGTRVWVAIGSHNLYIIEFLNYSAVQCCGQ